MNWLSLASAASLILIFFIAGWYGTGYVCTQITAARLNQDEDARVGWHIALWMFRMFFWGSIIAAVVMCLNYGGMRLHLPPRAAPLAPAVSVPHKEPELVAPVPRARMEETKEDLTTSLKEFQERNTP